MVEVGQRGLRLSTVVCRECFKLYSFAAGIVEPIRLLPRGYDGICEENAVRAIPFSLQYCAGYISTSEGL